MEDSYQTIKDKMAKILRDAGVTADIGAPLFSTDDPFYRTVAKSQPWPHFTYVVRFLGRKGQFSTEYHCGADDEEQGKDPRWPNSSYRNHDPRPHKDRIPTGHEILGQFCRDVVDARDQSFECWAGDFGYDIDSRAAEAIYNKCLATWHDVRKLLAESDIRQLAALSNQL